jgi:hypothetical protein
LALVQPGTSSAATPIATAVQVSPRDRRATGTAYFGLGRSAWASCLDPAGGIAAAIADLKVLAALLAVAPEPRHRERRCRHDRTSGCCQRQRRARQRCTRHEAS